MKISIITTCFNGGKTIEETIKSILEQKGDFELEYIITDAGSKDNTIEIIKSFGDKVKLVDAKGLNQSEGINLGLKMATGEIKTFLNADDVYEPGALQSVVDTFNQNPNIMWATGKCRIIDGSGAEINSWITRYKNFFLKRINYFLLLTENFISQPATFFRKEIFDEFGYFAKEENYVMDYEFWLRIGHKYKPYFVNQFLAKFRRTTGTKSNSGYFRQFKDDMRVAVRYAKRNKVYLAVPFKYLNYLKTVFIYKFLYK